MAKNTFSAKKFIFFQCLYRNSSSIKKILIGDNDQVILEFMNDMLTGEGHQVVTAESDLSASGASIGDRSVLLRLT